MTETPFAFSELRKSWKGVAKELGCKYSDEPYTFGGTIEGSELYRPPILTFTHRHWTITFTPMPVSPRVWLLPPTYMVCIQAQLIALRKFAVWLNSTETTAYRAASLVGPPATAFARLLPKPNIPEDDETNNIFELWPKNRARTNVTEIDLHYTVETLDLDDPKKILAEPDVREAILGAPKFGFSVCGFPGFNKTLPFFIKPAEIASFPLMHPDSKKRIVEIVRVYKALLDRLSSLGYIADSPSV
jgi:hypothetical protein